MTLQRCMHYKELIITEYNETVKYQILVERTRVKVKFSFVPKCILLDFFFSIWEITLSLSVKNKTKPNLLVKTYSFKNSIIFNQSPNKPLKYSVLQ